MAPSVQSDGEHRGPIAQINGFSEDDFCLDRSQFARVRDDTLMVADLSGEAFQFGCYRVHFLTIQAWRFTEKNDKELCLLFL